jgi:glycine C-acetyltransferase
MKGNLSWVGKEIGVLKDKSLYISFKEIDSPIDAKIKIKGKFYLNFSSNNYLGLANDARIKKAAISTINKYGIGPAAVRTIAGTSKLHIELEKVLAKFKKAEDVVTFQSGLWLTLQLSLY